MSANMPSDYVPSITSDEELFAALSAKFSARKIYEHKQTKVSDPPPEN